MRDETNNISRREVLKHLVDTIVKDAKYIRNVNSNYVLPLLDIIQEDGPTGKFLNGNAVRRAFNPFPVLAEAWDRLARDLRSSDPSDGKEPKPYPIILRFLSGHSLEPAYKNLAGYYDTFHTKLKYLAENPDYYMPEVLAPNQPLTLYKPIKVLRSRPIMKRHNLEDGFTNGAFEDSTEEIVDQSYVFLEKPAFIRIERLKDLESEYYVNNKMLALKTNVIRGIKEAHRYPLKAFENLRLNLKTLTDCTLPSHQDAKNLTQVVEKCELVVDSFFAIYNVAKSKIPPIKPLQGETRIRNFMGVV